MATTVRAMRIRRNPWITALTCVPWVLAAALAVATLVTGTPLAVIAPHLAIAGAIGFAIAWRRKPYARFERVDVSVDDELVRVGRETLPRSLATRAEMLPTAGGPVVRVSIKNGLARDIGVEDEGAAHRLMTALGFDASQRTATYRTGSLAVTRYRYVPIAIVPIIWLMMLLGSALHTNLFPFVIPLFVIALAAMYVKRTSVIVGVDGILVRWLWVREFIATKDITAAQRFEQGSGRNRVTGVEIFNSRWTVKLPANDDLAAMIQQRVRDAISVARSNTLVADDALLLARGELPLREWITRLKGIGAGATATLRTAAVMPEQLWRVASDPAQPATTRAAAAVALSTTLDDVGRVRLADLARATAEPKLRVALESAATDAPDEELEQTMLELGD
jgi:hypothetical protein